VDWSKHPLTRLSIIAPDYHSHPCADRYLQEWVCISYDELNDPFLQLEELDLSEFITGFVMGAYEEWDCTSFSCISGDALAGILIWGDLRDVFFNTMESINLPIVEVDVFVAFWANVGLLLEIVPIVGEVPDATTAWLKSSAKVSKNAKTGFDVMGLGNAKAVWKYAFTTKHGSEYLNDIGEIAYHVSKKHDIIVGADAIQLGKTRILRNNALLEVLDPGHSARYIDFATTTQKATSNSDNYLIKSIYSKGPVIEITDKAGRVHKYTVNKIHNVGDILNLPKSGARCDDFVLGKKHL
jgi:hypothetical protein